jgi:hypothetical protein
VTLEASSAIVKVYPDVISSGLRRNSGSSVRPQAVSQRGEWGLIPHRAVDAPFECRCVS